MKRALAILAFALACRADAPPATIAPRDDGLPVIDELAYYDALAARRPDVLASDECYDALALKPKYRSRVLAGERVAAIRAQTYTPAQRAFDARWAAALQAAELAYCGDHGNPGGCVAICRAPCGACPPSMTTTHERDAVTAWPSGYPLCSFVGYQIGPSSRAHGKIRDWKVFFEFRDDALPSIDAAAYARFTGELANAGFHGDSKIFVGGGGRVRYQYNDVIVHAASPDDARIAERVGARVFAGALALRARGLDLASDASADGVLDWHHYLCLEGKAGIPPEGLAFVRRR